MQISDDEILEWYESGILSVDLENPAKIRFRGRDITPRALGKTRGPDRARNKITFKFEGRRRTIGLNRLVYMLGTGQAIADHLQIHHLGDRLDDRFSQLVALTHDDHLKVHGKYIPEVPF